MDTDDVLGGAEQIGLEAVGQMAAVLDRPPPEAPAAGPSEQLEATGASRHDGALPELAAAPVDRNRGVGALVCVDANDHHVLVSLLNG